MVSLVVWTLVALAAAVVVLVVASRGNDGSRSGGPREVLTDVRAGLASWRSRKTTPEATARVLEPEPVDATFDEFFAAAEVDDDAYLQLDDLADTLLRARDLASRGVGLVRR
ncbi:hypothetical protein [Pengzhenrongella frigida]|uniref:Uncharacterized protein n=1 Tax=Pengzhenrongella frigida TaxID=1259133 RepID=A0A4V1ZHE5_9MICO|nr:hypothetical protein [Cellulomonas sp. HLT2-17]RYV51764.1 hypothetical protein EUA98_06740 [Cellulomonas sp. HLT2-17]